MTALAAVGAMAIFENELLFFGAPIELREGIVAVHEHLGGHSRAEDPELIQGGLVACAHNFDRVFQDGFRGLGRNFKTRIDTSSSNLFVHYISARSLVPSDNVLTKALLRGDYSLRGLKQLRIVEADQALLEHVEIVRALFRSLLLCSHPVIVSERLNLLREHLLQSLDHLINSIKSFRFVCSFFTKNWLLKISLYFII